MKPNIFKYEDYKEYLIQKIESYPKQGRGLRQKIAQALNCQITYISQVLNGSNNLSLEQAQELNKFFEHSEEESIFLIWLISFQRAGTASLKRFFKNQMGEARIRAKKSEEHHLEEIDLRKSLPGKWKTSDSITNPSWIIKNEIKFLFQKDHLVWKQESHGQDFEFYFKLNDIYQHTAPKSSLIFAYLDFPKGQCSFTVDGIRIYFADEISQRRFVFNIKVSLLDQKSLNISGNFSILEQGVILNSYQIHHDYLKV